MTTRHPSLAMRRARRSFWLLVVVAVLAAGSLSSALAAAAAPATGLRVVGSGLVLISAIGLATRVWVAVDRAVAGRQNTATSSRIRRGRHPQKERQQ